MSTIDEVLFSNVADEIRDLKRLLKQEMRDPDANPDTIAELRGKLADASRRFSAQGVAGRKANATVGKMRAGDPLTIEEQIEGGDWLKALDQMGLSSQEKNALAGKLMSMRTVDTRRDYLKDFVRGKVSLSPEDLEGVPSGMVPGGSIVGEVDSSVTEGNAVQTRSPRDIPKTIVRPPSGNGVVAKTPEGAAELEELIRPSVPLLPAGRVRGKSPGPRVGPIQVQGAPVRDITQRPVAGPLVADDVIDVPYREVPSSQGGRFLPAGRRASASERLAAAAQGAVGDEIFAAGAGPQAALPPGLSGAARRRATFDAASAAAEVPGRSFPNYWAQKAAERGVPKAGLKGALGKVFRVVGPVADALMLMELANMAGKATGGYVNDQRIERLQDALEGGARLDALSPMIEEEGISGYIQQRESLGQQKTGEDTLRAVSVQGDLEHLLQDKRDRIARIAKTEAPSPLEMAAAMNAIAQIPTGRPL